jgi:hypothetical protein
MSSYFFDINGLLSEKFGVADDVVSGHSDFKPKKFFDSVFWSDIAKPQN